LHSASISFPAKNISCLAVPARLLAALRCVGNQNGDVAIGAGADLLALLAPLSTEFGRLALTFGLHALIDRLAVLRRKIGAADPNVEDRKAWRNSPRR